MRPKIAFSKINQSVNNIDFEKLKINNPLLWKKLKKQFDTGRKIVDVQLSNGLNRLNEKTLRYYLSEFANRFLQFGPKSFPTSFNTLEPFFVFNHHNSIIQLNPEEESYGVSLVDFLDFVTSKDFDLDNIDFYENIPDKTIYHFSFTTGFDEINFSNNGKTFIIAGLSLIRQGHELSMLMQAGESYNNEEADKFLSKKAKNSIAPSMRPFKKSLGMHFENEEDLKVVHFEGKNDLWAHNVAALFDLKNKSIDIRFVARDDNVRFTLYTDDFYAIFAGEDKLSKEEIDKHYEGCLKKLSDYDAVFDFAKYCLALPYYVFENEKRIVDVAYETDLSSIIKSPVSKREYALVPVEFKIFAKPFYYLESNNQVVIKSNELSDQSFKVEKSGYWKRLDFKEEGFDKNGNKIIGKTWVERNDVYYSTPKGITKVDKTEIFDNENAGYIYIMRQSAYEENIWKIGLTQRSTEERRKELSNTSSVDKFFVINSYHTKDCIEAEKRIHNQLDSYRLSSRREFFRCDLKIVMDTCEKIINEINK